MGKKIDLDDIMMDIGIGKMVDIPVKGFLSTGSATLDWAVSGKLTGGGFPIGRIVELYGDPSTGKSLLATHLIANAQKAGWYTFLDDAENALDKFFATNVGANPDDLFYANSETIEGHFKRVSYFVRKIRDTDPETPILVVLDSLAALSTTHERGIAEVVANVEKEDDPMPMLSMDKRDMTKAQLVRVGMRILGTRFMKDNVLYVCCNHTTAQIGMMYGPKQTTPGGGGIKFHASVRIDLNKGKMFQSDAGPTGHETNAVVTKNKVAPPYKTAKFNIFFTNGVEQWSGMDELLKKLGYVTEAGGWLKCTCTGDKKYRAVDLIKVMPELIVAIEKEKVENVGSGNLEGSGPTS